MRAAVHARALEVDSAARVAHTSLPPASGVVPRLYVSYADEECEDVSDDIEVLTDDDILESSPLPRSGYFRVDDLDGEPSATKMSDVVCHLARLFDDDCVPRLTGDVDLGQLEPQEAWFVAMVTGGSTPMSVILETSPLVDEEVIRVVSSLIRKRAITLLPTP
jgi:hypothetical protein